MSETCEGNTDLKRIDEQLIKLFKSRLKCLEISETEKNGAANGFNYIGASAAFELSVSAITKAFRQRKCEGTINELVEKAPKTLKTEEKKIICQGVSGAYSHIAAKVFFGNDADISFTSSWKNVFESIESGSSDFGVVPVENSAAGSVSEVYGLIMKYRYFIVGAVNVSVKHCLAKRHGEKIAGVISHPQALLQCSEYIRKNKYIQQPYSNTAAAAKCISEGRKPGFGAICSKEAALKYGLEVADESIQDNCNNRTRFVVISKEAAFSDDANKISLCFSIPNVTGSLYSVLELFAYNGLNLSKIESRPILESDFEYDFYLDFEGNIHSKNVLSLLCSLNEELPRFSFLGNYTEV
jgi:chorismate mutase/prephenate dehydratase